MQNLDAYANLSKPGPVPGLKSLFLGTLVIKRKKHILFLILKVQCGKMSCSETSSVAEGVQFDAIFYRQGPLASIAKVTHYS